MKCPQCDQLLQMADRQGIEIDYCPQCRGVWLDRGELDKIIERSAAEFGGGQQGSSNSFQNQSAQNYPGQSHSNQGQPQAKGYGHQPQPDSRSYGHHKGHYKQKKRKTILGEIFDIFD